VPTATAPDYRHTPALRFALQGLAWTLGLFGLLRLAWLETHAILPLTQFQARLAEASFGAPTLPVQVTLACSGADALALCAGAILAYPVPWRRRIGGAAVGVALILALNIVRIGTLGAAAGSRWFDPLHVYVWPAALTLGIAGYVFAWMRLADAPAGRSRPTDGHWGQTPVIDLRTPSPGVPAPRLTRHFVLLSAAFVGLFIAGSPLYLESAGVLAVAAFTARAAALGLSLLGVQAAASGNILSTARGGFLVTQECLSTPLIPVYLAAVFSYSRSRSQLVLALVAAVPLFVGLGIARLLVVALPAALVGSPTFLIHAFFQLVLAAVVVVLAAIWRHGAGATAWRRALGGVALGAVFLYLLGPWCSRVITSAFWTGNRPDDPQGALALLPAFQIALYLALSLTTFTGFRWRAFTAGLALLAVSQIVLLAALHVVVGHAGLMPHVRDIRAWAVAAPVLLIAALVANDRPPR
jgi:exosortase/archaeosortase family protein